MAFFGGEAEEIKKLKRQVGSLNFKIGSLDAERASFVQKIDTLTDELTQAQHRGALEQQRVAACEDRLAKNGLELTEKDRRISDLQQSLDRARDNQSTMHDTQSNLAALSIEQDGQQLSQQANDSTSSETMRRQLAAVIEENGRLKAAAALPSARLAASPRPESSPTLRARRPRSSSVSEPTVHPTGDSVRLQSQLVELQSLHAGAQAELAQVEARCAKAEREALKASNEAMANQRKGEQRVAELTQEIREMKEDLKWQKAACEEISQELTQSERRSAEVETKAAQQQAEAVRHAVELKDIEIISCRREAEETKRNYDEAKADLSETQGHLRELEQMTQSLRADLEDAQFALVEAQQQLSSSSTTPTSVSEDGRTHSDMGTTQSVRGHALGSDNVVTRGPVHVNYTQLEAAEPPFYTEGQQSEVLQLRAVLAERDATIEQTDALAEESSRQLQLKDEQVKGLSHEITRLRQKVIEAELESQVLRAAIADDGELDATLDALNSQLRRRDEQLLQLREEAKNRSDEVELGKKQLKRLANFLMGRDSTPATSLNAQGTFASPIRGHCKKAVAQTPIAKLLKANHYFTTTGGGQLVRSFDEDLLDHVELMRDAVERHEQQQEFALVETEMKLSRCYSDLEAKTQDVISLRQQLDEVQEELRLATAGYECEKCREREGLAALQSDPPSASQTRQIELEEEASLLKSALDDAQASLKILTADSVAKEGQHAAELDSLRQRLTDTAAQTAAVLSITDRLEATRKRLHRVETKRHDVHRLEGRVREEDRSVGTYTEALQAQKTHGDTWATMREESEQWMQACRTALSHRPNDTEAKDNCRAHSTPTPEQSLEAQRTVLRSNARRSDYADTKIKELEARILRREEQIGAQQAKLQSVQTKLKMAEDDYEELLEEKDDLAGAYADLRTQLSTTTESLSRVQELAALEAQRLHEELNDANEQLNDLTNKVAGLTASQIQVSAASGLGAGDDDWVPTDFGSVVQLAEALALIEQLSGELQKARKASEEASVRAISQAVPFEDLQGADMHTGDDLDSNSEADDMAALQSDQLSRESSPPGISAEEKVQTRRSSDIDQELLEARMEITALREELEAAGHRLREQGSGRADMAAALRISQTALDLASRDRLDSLSSLNSSQVELEQKSQELTDALAQLSDEEQRASELAKEVEDLASQNRDLETSHQMAMQEIARKEASQLASEAVGREMEAAVNTLRATLTEEVLKSERLSQRCVDLEAALTQQGIVLSESQQAVATAEAGAQDAQGDLRKHIDDLVARLNGANAELTETRAALEEAKVVAEHQAETIKARHDDYWNLKEELAELQEQQERSRIVAQSAEALATQLEEAQAESRRLQIVQQRLSEAEAELSDLRASLESVENESARKTAELSNLREESKTYEVQSQSFAEELLMLKGKLQEADVAMGSFQKDKDGLEAQLQAALSKETRLTDELQNLSIKLLAAEDIAAVTASSTNAQLTEEIDYFKSRISNLEQDLEHKADEIESADGRILESLKENKRLAAKLKALHKQLLAAKQQGTKPATASSSTQTEAQETTMREKEAPLQPALLPSLTALSPVHESTRSPVPSVKPTPRVHEAQAVTSDMAPPAPASRKRASPDDDVATDSPASRRARGIYVPAGNVKTSSTGFMPVRRAVVASPLPLRGAGLQDRTNVGRATERPTKQLMSEKPNSAETKTTSDLPFKTDSGESVKRALSGAKVNGAGASSDLLAALHAKRRLASAHRA
ncbi:unnamed protein product [Parajaminaea phylloscopi]